MRWMGNGTGNGWSLGLAVLALGAAVLVPQVRADDAAGQTEGGAARLSSVDGQVRISQGGQVLADPALVNTPLFAGTQIETGDDGKAEIQFDDGSVARISPGSALTLTAIGANGVTAIVLEGGLAYFELQGNGPGGDTRVTFGDAMVSASEFTVMRIRMDNPPGELAVFSGSAHLQRGNALALDLHGGQSIALNGGDPSRYDLAETIEPDSWDAWNSDRDEALNATATDQTEAASNFTTGDTPNPEWNDLDANGNWYNVPGQGYVWSPYAASSAGWDPYGCGHWMWTPNYGYIWVSCESWGFLPYASGSWSYYDGFGWGWAPGTGRAWWRRGGGYHGVNIVLPPRGYHPIPMPTPRGPIGRTPPKIISINRGGFDHGGSNGGGEGLPVRNRNTPVEIGGHTVQPLRPMPTHRYEPSQSGFVYRPSQGGRGATYPGSTNPGQGNQRWGSQGAGNQGSNHPGPGNPGSGNASGGNPGSGFNGPRTSGPVQGGANGARGGFNSGGNTGHRDSYTPAPAPRFVPIPTPPTATHNELPGNNGTPGGNNATPNPAGPPNSGKPALGGLVPRDYYRTHPDSGVDRDGNGAGQNGGGQNFNRPTNGGSQPTFRPPSNGGNNASPRPGGGALSRPLNNGGGQPSPRPSGGGGFPGGGGAPRPPSGGGAPHPPSGGGAPHPSGGGGAPHGNGVR